MPTASRNLARLIAGLFLFFGLGLYLFPEWTSRNFAWTVTPFVVMTIGSWFLGGAFVAWRSARLGAWSIAYPGLLFLGAFGISQLAVTVAHRADIRFERALGVAWFLAILAVCLAAVVWGWEWFKYPDRAAESAPPTPLVIRTISAIFVVFSGYLGMRLLLGASRGGNIWPGALGAVTARAFGAFYLSLAIAVVPLVWSRTVAPILALLPAAVLGSIAITVPALVYIELFDFDAQPGGYLYIGTYLFVMVVATVILLRNRTKAAAPTPE